MCICLSVIYGGFELKNVDCFFEKFLKNEKPKVS